jgi:ribonuclease P/MRP protein subunit POP1
MAYKMRDGKVRWLSTHLWATKRMRMINYHGYKIAFTPNDKSFRSAYRHFRHNSCLIDLSYYQCLSLKVVDGEFTKLPDLIKIQENGNLLEFNKIYTI